MDMIEKKAEVFRIIRNFSELPKKELILKIKEHLPEINTTELRAILNDLARD